MGKIKLTKTQEKQFNKLNLYFRYNDDNGNIQIKDFAGYRKLGKKDISLIKTSINCNNDDLILELISNNAEHYSPTELKETNRIAKEQAKEANRIAKEQAKEADIQICKDYIKSFNIEDYIDNNTELLKMSIRLDLSEKCSNKQLINETITGLISRVKLLKATKQYETYSSLGYVYDSDGKVDQNAPVNYDIFYENHFSDKYKWQDSDENEKQKLNYVFYDTWMDACRIWKNNNFEIINMGQIRNIVRSYAPVSNKDIINDGFIDWVKSNRETTLLKDYFVSLQGKWDGIDRLGLFDESKDNIFLEVWGAEQSILYKHELNYWLIQGYRQTLHPCKYNYQHMLCIHGVSDNGKTKTLRDLFTFNIPGFIKEQEYFCEDLDISANNWTIAPLMNRNLALIFGERTGIDKASNNEIKKWVDKLNGTIQYQRKGENEIRECPSHCIGAITFNDWKILNDFSLGGYDKRFHIIHIDGTNERFVSKYLNTINDNKEQIWAQIAEWYMRYNDNVELLDISVDDKKQLNELQKSFRTITEEDVLPIINEIFYNKTYQNDVIDVIDKFNKDGNQHPEIIYITAIKAYCKQKYGWQTRHWDYLLNSNNDILDKIGLKYHRKLINNSRIFVLEHKNSMLNESKNDENMPF